MIIAHHIANIYCMFNGSVSTIGVTTSKLTQKMLSCKLEDMQFTDHELFANVSLLSGFQFPRLTHQLGYLSHLPQGLTFIPIHLSFKWWLGLLVSEGQLCPQCMSHSFDHFGPCALSCKNDPDVVSCHNRIQDTLFEFCQSAC